MIVPDVNLLLYAYDSASPFHDQAAAWWRHCLSGSEPVGLAGVVLFGFIRIGTSRRAFRNPLSITEAVTHVRSWFDRSITEYLLLEQSDVLRAAEWLMAQGVGGNLTTDAQIAALAARHNGTVHTADLDFARFPGVAWCNPLLQREGR